MDNFNLEFEIQKFKEFIEGNKSMQVIEQRKCNEKAQPPLTVELTRSTVSQEVLAFRLCYQSKIVKAQYRITVEGKDKKKCLPKGLCCLLVYFMLNSLTLINIF